jgi:hypothetical protein
LDDQGLMVVHVATKISEAKLESLLTREVAEGTAVPAEEKAKPEGEPAAPAPESKAKEGKK